MSEAQHKQKSVFGEIVDWTLAPLLILWPISMAIQYFLAYNIADGAYDRELRDSVVAISKQLSYTAGQLVVKDDAAAAAGDADEGAVVETLKGIFVKENFRLGAVAEEARNQARAGHAVPLIAQAPGGEAQRILVVGRLGGRHVVGGDEARAPRGRGEDAVGI